MAPLISRLPLLGRDEALRCLACGQRIGSLDETLRLRGNARVHRRCATYEARRRRVGSERLGFPLR
jgi:hypothetical protein